MTIGLAQPQLDAIAAACRQHHVARLHVFGSVLRPDYMPGESDIDLLVEFEDLQPTELVEPYFGLEQELIESMGSSIDLVMATAVRNPIVRADIDASKQLIYAA
jgi:predicted nucleotidyltransferase